MSIAEFIINGVRAAGKRLKLDGTTGSVYVDGDLVGRAKVDVSTYNGRPIKVELHVLSGVLQHLEVVGTATIAPAVVIQGDVRGGMSVACGPVRGSVEAGMDVTCLDVGGNVHGGMDVNCGTVAGKASAGMDLNMRSK